MLATRRKPARDLEPGDTIVFCGKGYRVTDITPYEGAPMMRELGAFGVAHVEGHGVFMSLFDGQSVTVAAPVPTGVA